MQQPSMSSATRRRQVVEILATGVLRVLATRALALPVTRPVVGRDVPERELRRAFPKAR